MTDPKTPKVQIQATRSETVFVEIDENTLHDNSIKAMRRRIIPAALPDDAYINNAGYWEIWDEGPHGSGSTSVLQKATEEEQRNFQIVFEYRALIYRMLITERYSPKREKP